MTETEEKHSIWVQVAGDSNPKEVDTGFYLENGIELEGQAGRKRYETAEALYEGAIRSFAFRGGLKLVNPSWQEIRVNRSQIAYVMLEKAEA